MAWIYLQASEDSHLRSLIGSCPLPTVKWTPIVKECSYLECLRDFFRQCPSGIISRRWTEGSLLELSILFTAVSPAKASVLLDLGKAWKMSEADLFMKYSDWPKTSDPPSYSWKMSQQLQPEVVWYWSKKLPRWGMIVDGVLYPLRPLERCIDAKDGSYWATPNTMDHLSPRDGKALERNLYRGDPLSSSRRKRSGNLREQIVYPQMWPTPTAQDAKNNGGAAQLERNTLPLNAVVSDQSKSGKKLSVQFVELMMGYPKEFTALNASVMPWFLAKRKKRSKS